MFGKTRGKNKKRQKADGAFYDQPENRLYILGAFWSFCFLLILLKLAYVQVAEYKRYRTVAKGHLEQKRELPAQRGNITDRNGQLLGVDLVHYSLAVKPSAIADQKKLAKQIGKILGKPSDKLLKRMKANENFAYLDHRVNYEKANALKALKINGLILEKKFSRYYPYKNMAAQAIGYCDFENAPKGGLEEEFDSYLKGKPGTSIYLRDALGNQFPNWDFPMEAPVNGMNVETTLNMVYQGILEDELKRAVSTHRASNGAAVLLDPNTGEVLGMANYPGFDPNRYNEFDIASFRNKTITDLYEPGSTFKMVSLALCIEQLNLDLNKELVFCENGKMTLAENTVHDHEPYAYLTAKSVFENSSNIGVIKLAQKFKAPMYYRYARDFGFGATTGIDLPAEAMGILNKPKDYSRYSLAYMSIGYEVSTTPLQVASAYAAIANKGKLMQPYLVKRIVDSNGKVHMERKPQLIRQVVKPETAARMKQILQGVVENGTGKTAKVSGIAIAGKTGTAQKYDSKMKKYSKSNHVGSFAGFFPVDDPRFVLMVVINNPRNGYYGSQVAAPAFSNIAHRIIGVPVIREDEDNVERAQLELPSLDNFVYPMEGMEVSRAVRMLQDKEVKFQLVGNGSVIYRQEPAAYSTLDKDAGITLFTETQKVKPGNVMPRLIGLSLKEALQSVSQWQIQVEVEGTGMVREQFPAPGKKMKDQKIIKLVCSPI